MRISSFAFLSVVTLTCAIISTQTWMTAQSERDPQTPAEYWLLLSAEAKREYVAWLSPWFLGRQAFGVLLLRGENNSVPSSRICAD
jgi:hypothetical protein